MSERSVTNATTGERVTFLLTAADTGGELLVMEDRWTRPGHWVPAHRHPGMEERWTILEGCVAYTIDGVETRADAGDTVIAPPGAVHSARDLCDGPVAVKIEMRPPLRWEDFVRQLFALASEDLPDDVAARSLGELFGEFAPEIELAGPGRNADGTAQT